MDQQDDFEIGVSKLRDDESGSALDTAAERHPPLFAHKPSRRRAFTGALAICALIGVLVVTLSRAPHLGETLGAVLRAPTPRPTPRPLLGRDLLLLEHPAPWGNLAVDGHIVHIETLTINNETGLPMLRLGAGRHTISYSAALFPPVECVVSAPAAAVDTCLNPFTISGADSAFSPPLAGARFVDLQATPDRLPAARQADLSALLASGIAYPPVKLHPGDHYLGPDGAAQTASAPMTATLRLILDPTHSTPAGCFILCAAPEQVGQEVPAGDWKLIATMRPEWTYTTASGQTLHTAGASAHTTVLVSVDMTDQTFALDMNDRLLEVALTLFEPSVWKLTSDPTTQRGTLTSYQVICRANPADGCLFLVGGSSSGATAAPAIALLYRFGVALPANETTRAAFPAAPKPSSAEQALAQTLYPPPAT